MARLNLLNKFLNSGPLLLLYYLSISEIDTNLEKVFEIFTFNLPIIIIYFWILKRPSIMGTGHIFIAGTPIGKTTEKGEVKLHVDPNQLSFVTVILTRNNKEKF